MIKRDYGNADGMIVSGGYRKDDWKGRESGRDNRRGKEMPEGMKEGRKEREKDRRKG